VLVLVIQRAPLAMTALPLEGEATRLIGDAFLTRFALAFELLAMILLTALVSAIYFARPED
jgi:NADH:ubiquinone oxidoreductase subunit 6 (subunit J)